MTTAGLIIFVGFAIYFQHDPRMADGAVTSEEMHWWEKLLLAVALITVITNILVATVHAFFKRRKWWGLLCVFVWPTSFVYAWGIALGRIGDDNANAF